MNLDDLSLEELYALEAAARQKPNAQQPPNNTPKSLDDLSLEELYALEDSAKQNYVNENTYTQNPSTIPSKYERGRSIQGDTPANKESRASYDKKMLHFGKITNQSAAKGITNLPNIPQGLYNVGAMGANLLGANLKGFSEEEMPGYHIQKGLKDYGGIDLNSEHPENGAERIYSSIVEGAAGTALGGGLGAASKAIPYLGKAAGALLGTPQTAGQVGALAATGGTISGALQTLQEAGIDTSPLIMATAALPIGRAAISGAKTLARLPGKVNNLRPSKVGYNDAARNLQTIIGKEQVPGAIESINKGTSNPSSFGYEPTSAELALNPGLSMLQETYRGSTKHPELSQGISERTNANIRAKNNKLTEFQPEGPAGGVAAQEHVNDFAKMKDNSGFEKTATPSEAGAAIRKGLKDELGSRTLDRYKKAGDKYEVIENIQGRTPATSANAYINKRLDSLGPESTLRAPLIKLQKLLKGEKAKTKRGDPYGEVNPKVSHLSQTRTEINGFLGESLRSGNKTLSKIYRDVKNALDVDLEGHPEVSDAWKKYAEASGPVNEIDLEPTFKKIMKSTDYNAHDVLPNSGVPREIVSASEKSQSVAEKFKNLLGDKKEVMEPVKGYINNKVIKETVDKYGNPSLEKIHKFKEKYPGAFTLYDHLDTKLKNMSNATKFLSDISEKNYKDTTRVYDNMFKSVVGSKPDKMAQSLFQGGDSTKKIDMYTKILKTDKTGQAWEGAKRATMDYISEQAESPAKFTKFYKGNLENLKRVVGPEEMHFLGELNDRYKSASEVVKQSNTTNSSTLARDMTRKNVERLVNKGLGRTILDESVNSTTGIITGHLSKVPGGKLLGAATGGAYKWYNNAISSSMQKNVHRALLEPSYLKMMLEDITTKQGKEAAKKLMGEWNKQRLSGYAIGQFGAEANEDDE